MSENESNPSPEAAPPKPAEASKVQPKKETVRITLPPKPAAGPAIKIPAGGGAASAPSPAAKAAAPQPATPSAGAAPAPAAAKPASAPAPKPAPAAAPAVAPMSRPRPVRAGAGVSGADKGLAIAAVVLGLVGLARIFFL